MPILRDMITNMSTLPSTAKEKQEITGGLEAPGLKEVGKESPLPSEVAGAGITLHPTSVTIPQPVAQLGVKPVGDTAVSQGAPAVALPLTDDQIAVGLHKSIATSWRWLAQWCIRRLRQLHMVIKKVHGKFVRVKS